MGGNLAVVTNPDNLREPLRNLGQKYGKYYEEVILVGDYDVLCLGWDDVTDESAL